VRIPAHESDFHFFGRGQCRECPLLRRAVNHLRPRRNPEPLRSSDLGGPEQVTICQELAPLAAVEVEAPERSAASSERTFGSRQELTISATCQRPEEVEWTSCAGDPPDPIARGT